MQQHNRQHDKTALQPEPALTVEFTLAPPRRRSAKVTVPPPKPAMPDSSSRIPRASRLMALALKFQDMVDCGEVRDYADLARLGYVSRSRITQIMNLLYLAPDIQEQLLDLQHSGRSGRTLCERHLRAVLKMIDWSEQRKLWRNIFSSEAA